MCWQKYLQYVSRSTSSFEIYICLFCWYLCLTKVFTLYSHIHFLFPAEGELKSFETVIGVEVGNWVAVKILSVKLCLKSALYKVFFPWKGCFYEKSLNWAQTLDVTLKKVVYLDFFFFSFKIFSLIVPCEDVKDAIEQLFITLQFYSLVKFDRRSRALKTI